MAELKDRIENGLGSAHGRGGLTLVQVREACCGDEKPRSACPQRFSIAQTHSRNAANYLITDSGNGVSVQ